MSRHLSFVHLSRNGTDYSDKWEFNESIAAKRDRNRLRLYLLHQPNEDENLVKWVKGFIYAQVEGACIEWMDKNITDINGIDEAKHVREAIMDSKKVILLSTPESFRSVWVPWELGIADQMLGQNNIAILPVANQSNVWEKRGYLQLYNRIEKPEREYMVLSPGYDFQGVPFAEWLMK